MFAHELGTECLNVLLVEDSRKEAQLTQRQLADIDDEFAVYNVSSLKAAQETLNREHFDAVVLDLGLPDAQGLASIDRLTQLFPELPLIVLSGRGDAWAIMGALEHGVQEFLHKDECSGTLIRQAILRAIFRKSMEKPM
jgi:DNA-binding response OmpR family regulator